MVRGTRLRATTLWDSFVTGDGLVVLLAASLVLAVTYPIQEANWVRGLVPLVIMGLVSVGFTTLLARFGFPVLVIHLLSLGLGLIVVVLTASAMVDGPLGFVRILNLYDELADWTAAIPTNEVRSGIVEFGMFLTITIWMLGHLTTWMALRHRQAGVSVAFGGAVLSIALSNFANSTAMWLSLFMAASVLLLIHMAISQRMVGWRERGLVFEPRTVLVQSGIILVTCVSIILVVSAIPTPRLAPLGAVVDVFEGPAQTASDVFSRMFNGLPSRRHVNALMFEETTHFKGGPNLGDDLIFSVGGRISEYWRARAYTTYTSTGWETVGAEWGSLEESGAGDLARLPSIHEFVVTAATDTLFHSGLAGSFNEPAEALTFKASPRDTLQVRFTEGLEFFPTRTNLRYTSTGNRSTASSSALQMAIGDIPQGIIDRYTQVPDTLPQRVRDLAVGLVPHGETQFDTVEALRKFIVSYPYSVEINAPPEGQDGVDYFLFDLRRGYCDYYASSLAVMLRTLGVPARYVLGYAPGQWDPNVERWQVLQLNYHSWVEVYFPQYGWIIFEATPPDAIEFGGVETPVVSRSIVDSLDMEQAEILEDEQVILDINDDFNVSQSTFVTIARVFWAVVLIVLVIVGIAYYRWWFRLGRLVHADELYAKMQLLATLLGLPPSPSQTPLEYGEALASEMPEYAESFRELARVYSGRRYASNLLSMGDLRRAEAAWTSLKWPLIRRLFRVHST